MRRLNKPAAKVEEATQASVKLVVKDNTVCSDVNTFCYSFFALNPDRLRSLFLNLSQSVIGYCLHLSNSRGTMNKIYAFREWAGMTQLELAAAIFVTQTAIANYEKGIRRPKIEIAKRLCSLAREKGFSLTFEDLYS